MASLKIGFEFGMAKTLEAQRDVTWRQGSRGHCRDESKDGRTDDSKHTTKSKSGMKPARVSNVR